MPSATPRLRDPHRSPSPLGVHEARSGGSQAESGPPVRNATQRYSCGELHSSPPTKWTVRAVCRATSTSRQFESCGTCKRNRPLRLHRALQERTCTSETQRRAWTSMGHLLITSPSDDNMEMRRVGDLRTITATETQGRRRAQQNLRTVKATQQTEKSGRGTSDTQKRAAAERSTTGQWAKQRRVGAHEPREKIRVRG